MKLTVKTLHGDAFAIEIELSSKVLQVKEAIKELKGHEVEQQTLVYSGKILSDDKTLEESDVKESGFIVMMVSKPKWASGAAAAAAAAAKPAAAAPEAAPAAPPASAAAAVPAAPAGASAAAPAAVAAEAQPAVAGPAEAVALPPAPAAATSFAQQGAATPSLVSQLAEMGFPEEQAAAALRAAYNNAELALEYLMTGLPDEPEAAIPMVPSVAEGGGGTMGVVGADGSLPMDLNLIPRGMEAQAGWDASAAAAAAAGGGHSGRQNPLAYLRFHPQFMEVQRLVQENPSALEGIMRELGAQSPELLQSINQHPDAFLELLQEPPGEYGPGDFAEDDDSAGGVGAEEDLMEGGSDDGGGSSSDDGGSADEGSGAGAGGVASGGGGGALSDADSAAVDRLMALVPSFPRTRVVEAFLACDRNEEMAANLLFDGMGF